MEIYPAQDYVAQPAPATPSANRARVYMDSADGVLKAKKSDGSVKVLEAYLTIGELALFNVSFT